MDKLIIDDMPELYEKLKPYIEYLKDGNTLNVMDKQIRQYLEWKPQ